MAALRSRRPQGTKQEGRRWKLINQELFVAGSHVLGRYLSLTKVNLSPNRACLLSFGVYKNIPLQWQDNLLFPDPSGHHLEGAPHRDLAPPAHHLCLCCKCSLPTMAHPPVWKKEVRVSPFHCWSNGRDFPALLPPASPMCRQWISCNPLGSPPLMVMYEIRGWAATLWSIISTRWGFAS